MNPTRNLIGAVLVVAVVSCGGGDDTRQSEGVKPGDGAGHGAAATDAGRMQAPVDSTSPSRMVTLWMPGSAEVVFMSSRGGNTEIYSARGVGGEWTNLTNGAAGENWPVWSPDGSKIAFQSSRNDKLDIYVMNADGSDTTRLTDHPEHDYLPSWAPDGKRIAFTSWRREPGDAAEENHIYIMNADGTEQRRLFPWSPGTSAGVSWSPDGKTLVIARKFGDEGTDIALVDLEGNVIRRLTDDAVSNGAPVFSPNGKQIAFYADSGDHSEIVVMNVDGSNRHTVVAQGHNYYPDWSPDGRYLIYTAVNPDGPEGNLDVMAIPADGGDVVVIAGGPDGEAEGRWRPFH